MPSAVDPDIIGVSAVNKTLFRTQLGVMRDELNTGFAQADTDGLVRLASVALSNVTSATIVLPAGYERFKLSVFDLRHVYTGELLIVDAITTWQGVPHTAFEYQYSYVNSAGSNASSYSSQPKVSLLFGGPMATGGHRGWIEYEIWSKNSASPIGYYSQLEGKGFVIDESGTLSTYWLYYRPTAGAASLLMSSINLTFRTPTVPVATVVGLQYCLWGYKA